jgi:adenosylcobinamide-GDP ribazoletransferase
MMQAFLGAAQFLTIIPVKTDPSPPASAAVFFPVIGALTGMLSAALFYVLMPWIPRGILAGALLLFWAGLNGGIHEDGLADCADALPGRRSKERRLEILKDSRIGTFGALALIFSALLRWQGLVTVPEHRIPAMLVAGQMLPRLGIVWLAFTAGPAVEGLGASLAAGLSLRHCLIATAIAAAIAIPALGWSSLPYVGASAVLIALLHFYFRHKLGGITGDCLGAANQIQEIVILALGASLP